MLAKWRKHYDDWKADQDGKLYPDRVSAFRLKKAQQQPADATR